MQQGERKDSDMQYGISLNVKCDMGKNKLQGHVASEFLKDDMRHWGPPIKGPSSLPLTVGRSHRISTMSQPARAGYRIWGGGRGGGGDPGKS